MSRLLERLASGEVLISDGATGTYLQNHGLEAGGCPEEFNQSHPEIVRQMARQYIDAGSDMVETNSFGGSRYMLEKYGHGDGVVEFNRLAAQHARAEVGEEKLVLGSIGPTGELLEPNGTATEEEIYEVFVEQVRGLADGGVDAICVETMIDMGETALAIRAVKEVTELPVAATLTFLKGPRGYFTMMGGTPAGVAQELDEAGADIVGANCGIAIEQMIEIIAAMRAATDRPILTHINAGIPKLVDGTKVLYPDTPEHMATLMSKVVEAGANIVGGCCGTNPDHVRAFVQALRG